MSIQPPSISPTRWFINILLRNLEEKNAMVNQRDSAVSSEKYKWMFDIGEKCNIFNFSLKLMMFWKNEDKHTYTHTHTP